MSIQGVDAAVLGVEDIDAAARFYRDFGLDEAESGAHGGMFRTRDGSSILVRSVNDTSLAPAQVGGSTVRETIWGVSTPDALAALGAELSRDRDVRIDHDGVLRVSDDDGYGLAFRVSQRQALPPPAVSLNIYGAPPNRPVNRRVDFRAPVSPLTIGHIVFFTPDVERAARFYVERLGFRVTDRFREGRGAFLRAPGSSDHHSLFLIYSPVAKGLHHVSFHVEDFNAIMVKGRQMIERGWQTQFGPGRHVIGSNCFWYFRSPCGGAMELSADMDRADDGWSVGEWDFVPENVAAWSSTFGAAAH